MAVTDNTTAFQTHDTAPSYTSIGSGQGAVNDADQTLAGAGSSGRRADNVTAFGFWYSGTSSDMSTADTYTVSWFKSVTPGNLTAIEMRVGSGTGDYRAHTGLESLYPSTGGWVPIWVGVDSGGSVTGTPTLTAVDIKAIVVDMSDITANLRNMHVDEDSYATRPCFTVDAASTLDDAVSTDVTNRSGVIEEKNGQYVVYSNILFGDATATTTDASGAQIVFPAGVQIASGQDWLGLDFDLQNASTDMDWTNGSVSSGDPSGSAHQKPSIDVTGTSGVIDFSGRVFNGYNYVNFTSGVTAQNCVFQNGSDIITMAGADLTGSTVSSYLGAADSSAVGWNESTDPDGEIDNMSITMGSTATHAFEFGASIPSSITIRGCTLNGYGSTNNSNDSHFNFLDTTGTITVNLVNCSTDAGGFSYRTAGATINLVEDPVTTQFTVQDNSGTVLENARVLAETADNGGGSGYPFEDSVTITQSSGTATVTHTAHGLATNDYVVIRGGQPDGYNKAAQITVSDANTYTYSVDSGLSSPATASPVSSYAPISGLTNASGQISSSKTWPASQGLKGWARLKNASSPFYKDANITVSDASTGTDQTLVLQPDE